MSNATRYPLSWPVGRPRTASPQRSAFKCPGFGQVRDELLAELRRLGAVSVILSTNLRLRGDGLPYAEQRQPADAGVAVYFELKGRELCFACDRWRRIEENARAIQRTIEAIRGIGRWGTGDMIEAAFQGFAALPAHAPPPPWRTTLRLGASATLADAESAYRTLALESHPDRGGSVEAMAQLNDAIERARAELGGSR